MRSIRGGPLSPTKAQRRFLTALPSLMLAATALALWASPSLASDERTLQRLIETVAIEFLLLPLTFLLAGIHETNRPGLVTWLRSGWLLLAFAVVAVVMSLSFGDWWPLAAIALLLGARWRTLFRPRDPWEREVLWKRSGLQWALGWGLLLVSPFLYGLGYKALHGIPVEVRMTPGPETMYLFAVLYFGLVGLADGLGFLAPPEAAEGPPAPVQQAPKKPRPASKRL